MGRRRVFAVNHLSVVPNPRLTRGDVGGLVEAIDNRLESDDLRAGKRRRYSEIRKKLLMSLASSQLEEEMGDQEGDGDYLKAVDDVAAEGVRPVPDGRY